MVSDAFSPGSSLSLSGSAVKRLETGRKKATPDESFDLQNDNSSSTNVS